MTTRPARWSAVVCSAALLAGCAQAVSGTAQPNQRAADEATAAAYERGIEAFRAHFRALGNEKAKVHNYYVYGDTKRTNEFESAKLGRPPATVLTKRRDESGDVELFLHPAGADVDYVRLSPGHRRLAPTPWVALPTVYPKELPFAPNLLLTSWVAVKLDESITETTLDAPEDQPKSARSTPDGGFELHSGASLGSMLDRGIASVPEELRSGITPQMRATILPVRMDFGPNWSFRAFEVRATVPGDPQLQIQMGYEVVGEATEEDIPATPPAAEVTTITDQSEADKFTEALNTTEP